MKRLTLFTGAVGIGKTTAAISVLPPSKVSRLLVVDTEDGTVDMQDVGFEVIRMERRFENTDILGNMARGKLPWVDERGKQAMAQYYDDLIDRLDKKLRDGAFDAIVLDTVEIAEAAITAAVESGRRKFGWGGNRAYGRMEVEGVRPLYRGLFQAIEARGVKDIILCSHLKPRWHDDHPVPGAVKPGGRLKLLSRLSTFMFWLVPGNDASGAPAAIVMKARYGQMMPHPTEDRWVTQRILPPRIPVFSWDAVRNYAENPADFNNLKPGEVLSEDERKQASMLFDAEQMKYLIACKQIDASDIAERQRERDAALMPAKSQASLANAIQSEENKLAVGMLREGQSPMKIAKELGIKLPQVIKMKKLLEGE